MKTQCGMLKEQGGMQAVGSRSAPILSLQHSAFNLQHSCSVQHPRLRRGLTLVELLITMAIMAIIAAAILGTAAAAMENARVRKTQALITKIHTLLMEHYASYETRRVEVHPDIISQIDAWAAAASSPAEMQTRSVARGQMLADARLLAVRELMKKEMPDRQVDIEHLPLVLTQSPPLAQTYYRRLQQLPSGESLSSAECLYMVVMNATGDGEARTLFAKQDIGDVDGDGAPEFIDGWGNPIGWIRWPAGVVSDLQPLNPDGTRPGETDHDPFDRFRRDSPTVTTPNLNLYPSARGFSNTYSTNLRSRLQAAAADPSKTHLMAYRLVPLVFSAGADGESAMRVADDTDTNKPLDPYYMTPDNYQAGAPDRDNLEATKDNITNHLIEY